MAGNKESFVTKYIIAKEKYENEKRKTPGKSYWSLFWDIVKNMFSKLSFTNLVMLIFLIPTILVLWYKQVTIETYGMTMPFGSNIGIGYPSIIDLVGEVERITFQTDLIINGLLIASGVFLSLALSGGLYLIRKYVIGQTPSIGEFFKGVKQNYFSVLGAVTFFFISNFLNNLIIDLCNYFIIISPNLKVLLTLSKIAAYIFLAISTIMTFWMLSMAVSYKMKLWTLIKNSFLMLLGFFPLNIVFGGLIILPAYFLLSSTSMLPLAIIIYGFIGISFSFLIWMCFSQWAFDKHFPKTEVVEEKKYTSVQYTFDENGKAKANIIESTVEVLKSKFELAAVPIKCFDDEVSVYAIPQTFKRTDLNKVEESKTAIANDSNAYVEEHKNDQKFVDYNKQFEVPVEPTKNKKGKKEPKGDFLTNGKSV